MQTLWQAVGPEATNLIRFGNDINRLGQRTSPSVGRRPSAVQSVPPQNSTVHGGCSVTRGAAEREGGVEEVSNNVDGYVSSGDARTGYTNSRD